LSHGWIAQVAWQEQDAAPGFRWGRLGDDYVGEWAGVLVVRASSDGSATTVSPDPSASRAIVEKITSGAAAAFIRSLQGRFSMHASAVSSGPGAILLTGSSGAGKSTLASLLCTKFGATLLADDIAGLGLENGPMRVEPSESLVWIDDGTGNKAPFARAAETRPRALSLVVSLRFADTSAGPAVRRIRGAETVTRLLEALMRFHPRPDLWDREFELMARLAAEVPVIELVRPRRLSADETAEFLVSSLQR
jgi:hypothetical protein